MYKGLHSRSGSGSSKLPETLFLVLFLLDGTIEGVTSLLQVLKVSLVPTAARLEEFLLGMDHGSREFLVEAEVDGVGIHQDFDVGLGDRIITHHWVNVLVLEFLRQRVLGNGGLDSKCDGGSLFCFAHGLNLPYYYPLCNNYFTLAAFILVERP